MTDDVVFLVPGRPRMRKDEFASALRGQTKKSAPKIDGSSEIRASEEIRWMTPNKSVNRSGYILGDSTVKLLERYSVIHASS